MNSKKLTTMALAMGAGAIFAHADVIINEVMQSNVYTIMDDIKEFPDSWVELYNNGDEEVNLEGWRIGLKDNFDAAYILPTKRIAPGAYALVYCDKADVLMHTDFRIDSGKGDVILFTPDGAQADKLSLKKQPAPDVAYGRESDGASKLGYELTPTPGAANGGGLSATILKPVEFSAPGGVWADTKTIQLKLSASEDSPEGSKIIYTEDGSEPVGSITDGVLTITNGKEASGTKRFSNSCVIRAKVVCEGCISIPSNAQSYIFMGREQKIPVVSIAINDAYLNDYNIGIFADGPGGSGNENFRNDWRRPMNIEYFVPGEAESVINQLGETRVQGGYTRINALKSMAFYANKRFGTKRFEYEFWPKDKPGVTDNKSFILRNGGNDFMGCYIRDGLIQRVIGRNTDVEWQGYTPALLFINGEYHAMLGLRERSNEDNIYSNFGGLEDIDMVENWQELKAGDYEAFDEFMSFIDDPGKISFDEWCEIINPESYINLMAINYWVYNTDFPHNNVVMWRKRTGDDTRWRWLIKDVDFGLGLYDFNKVSKNFSDFLNAPTSEDPTGYILYRKLMECPEFEEMFQRYLIAYCGDFMTASAFTAVCDEIVSENYGELGTSHETWKYKTWNFWADLNNNISEMRRWITTRGSNIPKFIANTFGLGSPVNVYVNRSMPDEQAAEIHLSYGGIPMTRGKFLGSDYVDRTIELATAPDDDVVGWTVKVGSGAEVRYDGSSLTLPITGKSDINITAIVDHAGIGSVAVDDAEEVYVQNGVVMTSGSVSVYDLSGRLVATGMDVRLPAPGVYIVKDTQGRTQKIAY